MAEEYSVTAKVYPTAEQDKFSILNMLEYFEKQGALRVSDLHIKVGTPPADISIPDEIISPPLLLL